MFCCYGEHTVRQYIMLLFVMLFAISAVFAQNKIALVIGNGAYSHFARLANSRNEVINMKDALQRIGFEVILVLDGSEYDILDALSFFHYGGHGVQVDGRNYINTANADIPDERLVLSRAVEVDEIIGAMEV